MFNPPWRKKRWGLPEAILGEGAITIIKEREGDGDGHGGVEKVL